MYPVIKAVQKPVLGNEEDAHTEYVLEMVMPQPWFEKYYADVKQEQMERAEQEPNILEAMDVKSGVGFFRQNYPDYLEKDKALVLSQHIKRFNEISGFLDPLHRQYAVQLYLFYKLTKPQFEARKSIICQVLVNFTDKINLEPLIEKYLDISFGIPTESLAFHIEQTHRAFLLYSIAFIEEEDVPCEAAYVKMYGQDLVDYFKLKARKKLTILDNYQNRIVGHMPVEEAVETIPLKYRDMVCFRVMDTKELAKSFLPQKANPTFFKSLITNVTLHRHSHLGGGKVEIYDFLPGGIIEMEVLKKLSDGTYFDAGEDFLSKEFERLTNHFLAKAGTQHSKRSLSTLRKLIPEIGDLKFSGLVFDENKERKKEICDAVKESTSFVQKNANRNLSAEDLGTLFDTVWGKGATVATQSDDEGGDEVEQVDLSRYTQILYAANHELIELFERKPVAQIGKNRTKGKKKKSRRRRTSSKTTSASKLEPSASHQLLPQNSGLSETTCTLFFEYAKQRLSERVKRFKDLSSAAQSTNAEETADLQRLVSDLLKKIQIVETKKDRADSVLISFNQETENVIANIQSKIDILEKALASERRDEEITARRSNQLTIFYRKALDHFDDVELIQGYNHGGRLASGIDLSMRTVIRDYFHNRIFDYGGHVQTSSGARSVSPMERFVFYVTNSSRTEDIWFCISIHKWKLKDQKNLRSLRTEGDFINPDHWHDTDRFFGSAYYVLHIPYPDH